MEDGGVTRETDTEEGYREEIRARGLRERGLRIMSAE